MARWYDAAAVCVTGGSFTDRGGHTPWEPAAHLCATLHGPHVANFADDYGALDQAEASLAVSAETLGAALDALAGDRARVARMGRRRMRFCITAPEIPIRFWRALPIWPCSALAPAPDSSDIGNRGVPMIRYNLRCEQGHDFDGWFRSSEGYDSQRAAGQVTCTICGSSKVEKALMAPGWRPPMPPRPTCKARATSARNSSKSCASMSRRTRTMSACPLPPRRAPCTRASNPNARSTARPSRKRRASFSPKAFRSRPCPSCRAKRRTEAVHATEDRIPRALSVWGFPDTDSGTGGAAAWRIDARTRSRL
ncbi:DUF1178 family protein [Paracoccus cavernae]